MCVNWLTHKEFTAAFICAPRKIADSKTASTSCDGSRKLATSMDKRWRKNTRGVQVTGASTSIFCLNFENDTRKSLIGHYFTNSLYCGRDVAPLRACFKNVNQRG
jgi:hypothetical protein